MEFFSPGHLLVVLAIAILVFGPKKLPELGKGLGEAIRGFKSGVGGGADDKDKDKADDKDKEKKDQSK